MYRNRFVRAAEALGISVPTNLRPKIVKALVATLTIASLGLNAGAANAVSLTSGRVALSDPRPSQTLVNYTFTGSSVQTVLTKCIMLRFATTATGSTVPTSFDSTVGGVAINNAGTNYVPTPGSLSLDKSVNGTLKLTDAAGQTPASGTSRTVSIDGITNSSIADTAYWLHVDTYSNADCATGPLDTDTVEFINTNGSTLSLTVDQTLSFTVALVGTTTSCDGTTTTSASTATTIPFGTVTASTNAVVCQDITAATNSTNGYTVYIRDTGQAANSLSQTLSDWTGTNGSPTVFSGAGTEAYGYTTNDSSLGTGTPDRFTNLSQKWSGFNHTTGGNSNLNNTEVAYTSTGVTSTTNRIGFQAGVSLTTRPGTYQTTVLYTCTPVY